MLTLEIAGPQPAPPWLARGDVPCQPWRDPAGNPTARAYRYRGECWVEVPGQARFWLGAGNVVFAYSEPGANPASVREIYLRSILPVALQARGTEVLHASAVRFPRGVVLFCAESGTGKSTIAFGLSQRGFPPWGDDAVAVGWSRHVVQAVRLPFTIHLRPDAAAFYGPGHDDFSDPGPPAPDSAERFHARLAAVCVLSRRALSKADGSIQIARLSPGRAFLALLPHAYCAGLDDLKRTRRMMERYLELSARVPVFDVRLRTGLDYLTAALDGIVRLVGDLP